jgi:N utilization substance protein A
MINAKDFVKALQALEADKNIPQDIAIEALKQALINAYQKENGKDALVRVDIDPAKGIVQVYNQKTIVAEVQDDFLEISLEDAKQTMPQATVGDMYEIPVSTEGFERMAVLHVKQILRQKIREAEKQVIYDEYINKKDEIIVGTVDRVEDRYTLINIGKTNALLPSSNQIPNETYYEGQPLKVYVLEVDKSSQGAQVVVSRTEPGFLKRLFENEIMEVYDGTVEIRSIAREPGERAKVAVSSRDPNVDPTGACIGQKGMRIQKITSQLANEKIDVIQYHEEPEYYIAEALKPAHVYGMSIDSQNKSAVAVVPNEELSLAIGRKGQNARLAVKLTGWKIDIKTVDSALEEKIRFQTMAEIQQTYAALARLDLPVEPETVVEATPVVASETIAPVEAPVIVPTVVAPVVTPTPVVEPVISVVAPTVTSVKEPEKELVLPWDNKMEEVPAKPKRPAPRPAPKAPRVEKKDVQEDKKDRANYMPVYTEDELRALEEAEQSQARTKQIR